VFISQLMALERSVQHVLLMRVQLWHNLKHCLGGLMMWCRHFIRGVQIEFGLPRRRSENYKN